MNRDALMSELTRLAEQLCDPHQHIEVIWDTDQHRHRRMSRAYATIQAGLLAQLREIGHEGLRVGSTSVTAGKPASKPPGLFEAMARHVYIAATVATWCQVFRVELRMSVEENIRGLIGVTPAMDDEMLTRFAAEMRYWHGQAATATGWSAQPFHPWVRCPQCRRHSTLSISLTEDGRGVRSAYCDNTDRDQATGELMCGASWTGPRIDHLVRYIRSLAEDDQGIAA